MGQLTLSLQREWENNVSSRKLPSKLLVVLCIWFGIAAVSIIVLAIGRFAPSPVNPFATFVDIFPGQTRTSILLRGFSCQTSTFPVSEGASRELCTLNPVGSIFSQVTVAVYMNVVQSVQFTLRGNTLRIGDLMLLWGTPEITEYNRSLHLRWRRRGIFVIARRTSGRFSLYLPVRRVSVGDTAGLLILQ